MPTRRHSLEGLTKKAGHLGRIIASGGRSTHSLSPKEQREKILADRYLRQVYSDLYNELLSHLDLESRKGVVEIGSGPGVLRDLSRRQGIILSDVVDGPGQDVRLDARSLPFGSGTIRGLILKDSLHHIPDVDCFLNQATRVLVPGGRIAIVDPYWGALAKMVYRFLHPEPFDQSAPTWDFASTGPTDSNQALLWILLRRDRNLFEERFPNLTLNEIGARIGPSFLLSGGLHGRSIVPNRLLEAIYRWETSRGCWFDRFRFFHIVIIERVG